MCTSHWQHKVSISKLIYKKLNEIIFGLNEHTGKELFFKPWMIRIFFGWYVQN